MVAAASVAAISLDQAAADAIAFPPHIFREAIFPGLQPGHIQAAVASRQAELSVRQLARAPQLAEARASYRPVIARAREQERALHRNLPREQSHRGAKLEPDREANLLSCQPKVMPVTSLAQLPELVLARAWPLESVTARVSFLPSDRVQANDLLALNRDLTGVSVHRIATVSGKIG